MTDQSKPPPPGWYTGDAIAGTQRYWDGQAWDKYILPLETSRPAATEQQDAASASPTRSCPYCGNSMAEHATRCPSCAGQLMWCKRCQMNVGTTSKQKWVGIARGGSQVQHRCARCDTVVAGPRW